MPLDLPPHPDLWLPSRPAIIRAANLDELRPEKALLFATFAASSVRGARPASAGLSGVFFHADTDIRNFGTGSSATFNFTMDLKEAAANRAVVITIASGTTPNLLTVVANGVSLTKAIETKNTAADQESASIWAGLVTAGSGPQTVSLTYSTSQDRQIYIDSYALYGFNATASATVSDNDSNPGTGSLANGAGSANIGAFMIRSNAGSGDSTWGGLTEDSDQYSSGNYGGSAASILGTGSSISVSATFNATPFRQPCLAAASFPLV